MGTPNPLVWVWVALAGPMWMVAGAALLPRLYRSRRADPALARLAGGSIGAAYGLLGLAWMAIRVPSLRRGPHVAIPLVVLVAELVCLFALLNPTSLCVTDASYVANQLQNGLAVGMVYATMAVGLTLIYSVQRIVSFTHGQFVMLGGIAAYLLLSWTPLSPYAALPIVGILVLGVGFALAWTFLRRVAKATVERPDEFAILMTFGIGIFMTYALVAALGSPAGIKAPGYTDRPLFGLSQAIVEVGVLRLRVDVLVAGAIGLILFAGVAYLLYHTWLGHSFRAVSMDRQAATVVGIDASRVFYLAFAIGTMLAGVAGATLVPTLAFQVPDMAAQTAIKCYVIVVLGGLGSVRGALIGGLLLGGAEALVAACYPDVSKGATYQAAAGLLMFMVVLSLRPQGLFGRAEN